MSEENEIAFDKVDKPHDCLIKWSFGRNYVASAHCKAYCPISFVPIVNWDKLVAEPGSFVDPNLSESHTDLLFKAPLLNEGSSDPPLVYFYFLIEHITNPKADTVLRLAEYKLAIWRKIQDQSPKRASFQLPVILPFIMHQGTEWNKPTQISDSLQLPEKASPQLLADIRDVELDMGCIIVVVPNGEPEKIKGHILGRVTLALMNAARENRALEFFNDHGEMIADLLKEQDSMALLNTLLRYTFQVDDHSWDRRQEVILTIQDKTIQSEAMSIAEQIEAIGIEKGKQEGVEKSLIAIKMIQTGKSDQEIVNKTNLSLESIKKLRKDL